MSDTPDSAVRTYIEQHRAAFLDDLADWLRIPSVSAQPDHAGGRTAQRRVARRQARRDRLPGHRDLADARRARGLRRVALRRPGRTRPSSSTATTTCSPPPARTAGTPTRSSRRIRDGRIYARGAADDKGQVFFHTLGVRAHLAATGRTAPAVNLKLLIEGEEESGSPHFRALVEAHADRLAADVVIVSDTGMWSETPRPSAPACAASPTARSTCTAPARTSTPAPSAAPSPTRPPSAARLVAALHDDDGQVTIPGFYDGVVELTDARAGALRRAALRRGAPGCAPPSRRPRSARPGTPRWSGSGPARPPRSTASAAATRAPAARRSSRRRAQLKLSFRLVAGQDPDRSSRRPRLGRGTGSRPASGTRSPSAPPPAPA